MKNNRPVKTILAVTPPLYRLLTSHNNRLLLSLHCLAEAIDSEGVETLILNLDAERHEQYASWPEIYAQQPNFDARLDGHEVWDEYVEWLVRLKPDVVIVGAGDLVLPTVDFGVPACVRKVGRITKAVLGDAVTTYVYGVFPTLDPGAFVDVFDGVIVSEAETARVWHRILRRETGVILGELTEQLDAIPYLKMERLCVTVNPVNMDYIVSSRGCAWHCHFCVTPVVCRRMVRFMSGQRFLDEVKFRRDKYGLRDQYFADMNFFVDEARANAIMLQMIDEDYGIRWWCETRAESLTMMCASLAKKSGCSHVKIGVEGNDVVMAALGKKETEKDVRRGIEIARKAGLGVVVYTMLGAPGLSDADFKKAHAFLASLDATHYVVNMTVPHRGTPLFAQCAASHPHQLAGVDGWQHLDSRLRDFWGISPETVEKYMELNSKGKKEDSGIRQYGKKSVAV